MITIGHARHIIRACRHAGATTAELPALLGVSASTLAYIEAGGTPQGESWQAIGDSAVRQRVSVPDDRGEIRAAMDEVGLFYEEIRPPEAPESSARRRRQTTIYRVGRLRITREAARGPDEEVTWWTIQTPGRAAERCDDLDAGLRRAVQALETLMADLDRMLNGGC